MQSETHVLGDTLPLVVVLIQTDGTPYDLSDCSVSIGIRTAATCITVPGRIPDPLLGAVLFDLAGLDVPARLYRTSVEVTWSDGTRESAGVFALNLKEAC